MRTEGRHPDHPAGAGDGAPRLERGAGAAQARDGRERARLRAVPGAASGPRSPGCASSLGTSCATRRTPSRAVRGRRRFAADPEATGGRPGPAPRGVRVRCRPAPRLELVPEQRAARAGLHAEGAQADEVHRAAGVVEAGERRHRACRRSRAATTRRGRRGRSRAASRSPPTCGPSEIGEERGVGLACRRRGARGPSARTRRPAAAARPRPAAAAAPPRRR